MKKHEMLKGKVVSVGKTYIIFERNYTGYILYVSNPSEFAKDQVLDVYVSELKSEYTSALYGFKTESAKDCFHDLLKVNGIGAKTALQALKTFLPDEIKLMVVAKDTKSLTDIDGVGYKMAQDIVNTLNFKYAHEASSVEAKNKDLEDVLHYAMNGAIDKKASHLLDSVTTRVKDLGEDISLDNLNTTKEYLKAFGLEYDNVVSQPKPKGKGR